MTTMEASAGRHGRQRPEAVRPRPDAAQGGPAVHPGTRQLRRRHQPARHAAPGDPAFAVRPRADQQHRCLCGPSTSEGQGRRDRCRPRREGPGLDADAVQRRAGGAGHRQGAVPGPGGGVRRRRGPLLRPRRAGAHRRRLRARSTPVDRRPQGARPRRRGDPHRPRGQDRQPLLRLGDRRCGGHRGRVRQGRRRRQAGDRLSARASRADGNLRCRSRSRPGDRQADAVVDDAGAARAPHAVRVGGGPARAQDPGHLTGHRRRVRQQGADLPRIRVRDRRLAAAGQAGQVDGGPQREPHQHRLRPRLHHGRRDRGHQGRQDPGDPVQRARRPRRVQRHRGAGEVPGRLLRRVHRQLRHRGRVLPHDRGVHQQGARRRGVRLLVPHHRGGVLRRAPGGLPGVRAEDGSGAAAAAEPVEAGAVPVQVQDRLGVRLGRLRDHHAQGHGHDRLRRAARRAEGEARARRADGHRHVVLHRGGGRRAPQGYGHPRPRHGRRLRAARASDRQSRCAAVGSDAGAGPRDDVRPDRRRGAGHSAR